MGRDGFQVIEADEVPPMNEEIDSDVENALVGGDNLLDSAGDFDQRGNQACNNVVPDGCDPEELNPRNYAFLPSCWTSKIRPAGRATQKVNSLAGILC